MTGSAGAGSAAARTAARETIEAWRDEQSPGPPPAAPPADDSVDFHRVVATLREHPHVLRALGLIVELTFPVSALNSTDGGEPAQVSVGCPKLAIVTSPWTAYEAGGRRCLPASAGDIRGGLVDLTGATRVATETGAAVSAWSIVTVDVDGAVALLRSAAATLAKEPDRPASPAVRPGDAPDALQCPALRLWPGVMLVRRDRLSLLNRRRAAAATNAAWASRRRLPVRRRGISSSVTGSTSSQQNAPWRPLCSRLAAYTVGGVAITDSEFVEEGHAQLHALVSDADGGNLRGDEVVARWTGWSLV